MQKYIAIVSVAVFLFFGVLAPKVVLAVEATTPASDLIIPNVTRCLELKGGTLSIGSRGMDVQDIQKILNIAPDTRVASSGPGSPGMETDFFGALTQQAVITFQEKYANDILVPADLIVGTGIVGMYTRAKVHALCGAVISSHMTQNDLVSSMFKKTLVTDTTTKNTKRSHSGGGRTSSKKVPTSLATSTVTSSATVSLPSPTLTTTSTTGVSTPPSISNVPLLISKPTTAPTLEWGAFAGSNVTDLSLFEDLVGKQVTLRSVFTDWSDTFPFHSTIGLKGTNKTLVIFWEQNNVSLDSIIAGYSDTYIRKFAEDAKLYGGQIIIAPFHEMNGNWTHWSGVVGSNTPEKVIAAWRHVYDVFGKVSNVKFAWTVNSNSVPNTSNNAIERYYPGDAYVDYVAVDGFNFGDPWYSFDTIFSKPLTTLAQYNKPIYILSMGVAEGPDKAAWITDAFTVQVKKYPLLKGWVWFNQNKEKDWRVNSNTASLRAFEQVLP